MRHIRQLEMQLDEAVSCFEDACHMLHRISAVLESYSTHPEGDNPNVIHFTEGVHMAAHVQSIWAQAQEAYQRIEKLRRWYPGVFAIAEKEYEMNEEMGRYV